MQLSPSTNPAFIPDGVTVHVVVPGLAGISSTYPLRYNLDANGVPDQADVLASAARALEALAFDIRKGFNL